jgi:hypothetical protein
MLLQERRKSCHFGLDYFNSETWNSRLSCLQLASRPTVPFGLSEVMRYMSAFDCADPRDRLYGILHLAYGEGDTDRPIPDYEKDRFAVVTELLRIQHVLTFPPPDLDNAIFLTQMLGVPLDLDRFDQAWKEHQATRTSNDSLRGRPSMEAFPILLQPSSIKSASFIRAWNDSSRLDESQRERQLYLTEAPEITCTHYLNAKVETIYVPPETGVGDMFVSVRTNAKTGRGFGLIIRRKGQTRFGIVGVANHLIEGDVHEWKRKRSGGFDYGNFFWHPLELQLLATVLAHYRAAEYEGQDFNKRLNRRSSAHLKLTEFSIEQEWTLDEHKRLVPHWG